MSSSHPPVFGEYTAAALDAQYDNRAAVPGHPAIFARWTEDSRRSRRRLECRLDLAYGPGQRERLDWFPAATRDAPLHVFLHGGYWQAMDKSAFSFLAEPLVAAGLAVAVLGYPLCPAVSLDDIIASTRRAVAWLARNGRALGADTSRVHLCGHSAGGHLAAMLMTTRWPRIDAGLPGDLIGSALSVSGLFDLEPLRHTKINAALGLDAAAARRASPLLLAPQSRAPLLAAVGGLESAEYHRQSAALVEAWRPQGLPAELLDCPGLDHFTILDALAAPDGALLAHALRLAGLAADRR